MLLALIDQLGSSAGLGGEWREGQKCCRAAQASQSWLRLILFRGGSPAKKPVERRREKPLTQHLSRELQETPPPVCGSFLCTLTSPCLYTGMLHAQHARSTLTDIFMNLCNFSLTETQNNVHRWHSHLHKKESFSSSSVLCSYMRLPSVYMLMCIAVCWLKLTHIPFPTSPV